MKLRHIFEGTYVLKLTIKHKLWKEYFTWLRVKWVYDLHFVLILLSTSPFVVLCFAIDALQRLIYIILTTIIPNKYRPDNTRIGVAKDNFREAFIKKGGKLRGGNE